MSHCNRKLPDERESHLSGPGGHDLPDGLLAGVGEGAPQVLGQRVLVGVLREVRVHPATEGVVADEVVLHRVGPSVEFDSSPILPNLQVMSELYSVIHLLVVDVSRV